MTVSSHKWCRIKLGPFTTDLIYGHILFCYVFITSEKVMNFMIPEMCMIGLNFRHISCGSEVSTVAEAEVTQVAEYPWKQFFLVADVYLVANQLW